MVLLVLAVCGAILASAGRRNADVALRAGRERRELQLRWGALSCRAAVLPMAEEILQEQLDPERIGSPDVRHTVALGDMKFHLVIADEQAKANINALASRSEGAGLLGSIRIIQGAGGGEPALKEFAQWVDDQVTSKGYRPAILEGFPIGSIQGERYYLHTFYSLARLPFVPQGDAAMVERALALGPETDVAIMGYPTTQTGVVNYLFVIRYPTAADATAAYNGYSAYLDGSTTPAERNIAVAPPVQTYLAGTFNAEENSIRDRLAEVLTGLGG